MPEILNAVISINIYLSIAISLAVNSPTSRESRYRSWEIKNHGGGTVVDIYVGLYFGVWHDVVPHLVVVQQPQSEKVLWQRGS